MIPFPNQPFDFGYSDTCECNDDTYIQTFAPGDTIQAAFQLEQCGEPTIETTILSFAGAPPESFEGNVVCTIDGSYELTMDLSNVPVGFYYMVQINAESLEVGSVSAGIDGTPLGTITQSGVNTFFFEVDSPLTEIIFKAVGFTGCINFVLTFTPFPIDESLDLYSNGEFVAEFDSVFSGNAQIFSLTLPETGGTYQLSWVDSCVEYSPRYFSGAFCIAEQSGCTVTLSGCFPGSQLGWPAGFLPFVRLSGRLRHSQYTGTISKFTNSAGYSSIQFASRRKTMDLAIDQVPEYILDYISVWITFEQMYINGESYRITDSTFPEVSYLDKGSDLGQLVITVERVRQLFRVNRCNEAPTLCQEIPAPPNIGTQKQFQDGIDVEFQDGILYTFQN